MEAQAGAKIVFWSELNGAVLKQDEDILLQRASDMAKQEEIYLIVPAADWRGMTLLASKTAIVRGVENGSNIIRHTNKGMSIVSDCKGRVLAQTDYFQSDTKTLSAQVTMKGRFTLYSYVGNLFVYLCSIYLLGSLALARYSPGVEPISSRNCLEK